MLLGVRFVLIVPLWYKFKPTSPRDADTANALRLEVWSVAQEEGYSPLAKIFRLDAYKRA